MTPIEQEDKRTGLPEPAFYDRTYSVGFGRRIKLWFESLRLALSSVGAAGRAAKAVDKAEAAVEKNNEKRKTPQIVILPQAASIRGDLVTDGDVKFHGRIQGNITTRGAFVIGRGGVVRGDIQAQVCAIGGKVIGNVRCTGSVEVMDSGYLRGDVEASDVVLVKGKVRGNVRSSLRASLMSTANVIGDLESPRIRIDAGAEFKGRINCDNSVETGGDD
jgi:cytoskeletal protein CcmA (bactofilin family)